VHLFALRALELRDTFQLEDAHASLVVEICRRLDGLPLAIELAAACADVFGVRTLAAHLDGCMELLTGGHRTTSPRQQSLRATLDWSHATLSKAEQVALRRLAVFAGSFELESASTVMSDDEAHTTQVPDILTRLVAKSLLATHVKGEKVLFRLLHTTRVYALEKLEDSDESAAIKRRRAQLCSISGAMVRDWGRLQDPATTPRNTGSLVRLR